MSVPEHVQSLHREAVRSNERRVVVVAGSPAATKRALRSIVTAVPIGIGETVYVGSHSPLDTERIDPRRTVELMGAEAELVLIDLQETLIPNAIGRCAGAVTGGGLLVLRTPPLEVWPDRRDAFDESLVVAPFQLEEVTGRFRQWLIQTLFESEGVTIVDANTKTITRSGLTGADAEIVVPTGVAPPADPTFPASVYHRCLTADQRRALLALEGLQSPPAAVILQADRGRGKSSVAGMAAAVLAGEGMTVAITATERTQVDPLFEQAEDVLAGGADYDLSETSTGGSITFYRPGDLLTDNTLEDIDVLFADEAAGLPVPTLEEFLVVPRVAFTTTLHGYEGAGHGFATRFREIVESSGHRCTEVRLNEPIRYAPNDPVERWVNRVLFLDARPAVTELLADVGPESVCARELSSDELFKRPTVFREAIGLLAMAHYRTEPNDIVRMLDAPNLDIHALLADGHVAAIALLAREGKLSHERRLAAFRGARLRGNMLPDIFLNEFRDLEAASTSGIRVIRIATHPAVRRRGLGSRLISHITDSYGHAVDWLAAGYGATPGLVRFWADNGFKPIFLSASRNASSGVYSTVMIRGVSSAGETMVTRFSGSFAERLAASLPDVHREVDADTALALLAAVPQPTSLDLSNDDWRFLTAIGFGPGRYDLNPEPLRTLLLHALTEGHRPEAGSMLVEKVLQGRPWPIVADRYGYDSVGTCRRAVRGAVAPLIEAYGGETVEQERERLRNGDDTNVE